jgi:hypothetical protein
MMLFFRLTEKMKKKICSVDLACITMDEYSRKVTKRLLGAADSWG